VALLLGLALSASAFAEIAGTVTHLSGPLLAKKADGTSKILSQKSVVESGDLLVSEKDTYARVKFTDNSEITLKPNTQIRIDAYLFDEAKPEADSAVFNLIKGGLRALTGLVGKRGNQDSYKLKAPSATIGIRGTDYIAQVVGEPTGAEGIALQDADMGSSIQVGALSRAGGGAPIELEDVDTVVFGAPPGAGGMAPGLYVQVLDGMIQLSNQAGAQTYGAGQFGYTPSLTQPPVILPSNPGIQFTPPPSFNAPAPQPGQPGSSSSQGSKKVDCEVR
jgi:hypothetical protein